MSEDSEEAVTSFVGAVETDMTTVPDSITAYLLKPQAGPRELRCELGNLVVMGISDYQVVVRAQSATVETSISLSFA